MIAMLVAMPLQFVWLARAALGWPGGAGVFRLGRVLLGLTCVTQGLVTALFLFYVHCDQREIAGDYGRPYAAQVRIDQQVAR